MSSDYFSDVKTEISGADIANLKRIGSFPKQAEGTSDPSEEDISSFKPSELSEIDDGVWKSSVGLDPETRKQILDMEVPTLREQEHYRVLREKNKEIGE